MTARSADFPVSRALADVMRAVATPTELHSDRTSNDALLDAAVECGVAPLIADTMTGFGRTPPAVLTQARTRSVVEHLTRTRDLGRVASILDAAGIRWLVFKGPALGALLYPRPGSRTYSDIDILIHPTDFANGLQALLSEGAILLDQNWHMIGRKRQGEISLVVGATLIDLHWHFFSSEVLRGQVPLDITAPIGRRVDVEISGLTVPTLDPVDTAIFVTTHAVLSGAHKLKWFYDIHRAFRAPGIMPSVVKRRAHEYNVTLMIAVMVDRVSHYLDDGLTDIVGDLGADPVWRSFCKATNRYAPPEADLDDRYSGRAVFSATRASTAGSVNQLRRNAVHVLTARDRRGSITDRTELHTAAGTSEDKATWLEYVALHG